MSLLQKTISTLKECSDFTGPTIMAIMTKLMMSETLFREWSKETSTTRKPPSAHQLIDFVEQYRRALAVQPGAAKQGSKPTSKPGLRLCTPPSKEETYQGLHFPCAESQGLQSLSQWLPFALPVLSIQGTVNRGSELHGSETKGMWQLFSI